MGVKKSGITNKLSYLDSEGLSPWVIFFVTLSDVPQYRYTGWSKLTGKV
jgi:hypothetical protein